MIPMELRHKPKSQNVIVFLKTYYLTVFVTDSCTTEWSKTRVFDQPICFPANFPKDFRVFGKSAHDLNLRSEYKIGMSQF